MLIGNNETTKIIDHYAINNLGIPSIVLMENAAISFMKHIDMSLKNYLVICGKGNNGGDGYAIARHLHSAGKNVNIFSIGNENLSNDCQINYNICKNLNIKMFSDIKELDSLLLECEAVIEGIFGTGLNSDIGGIYKIVIQKINAYSHSRTVYSIDIPSGIDGNNGEVLGIAVKADKTISFITYKKAFLNIYNKKYFGDIYVEEIGFNINNISHLVNEYYLTRELIEGKVIGRKEDAHKGDFGRVLIFAGSNGFSGAASIVSESCVRAGAGLVTLMTYDNTFSSNTFSSSEAMILEIENKNIESSFKRVEDMALNSDVITIGPGIGKSENSLQLMKKLLQYKKNNRGNTIKLVIDADGLNLLSENPELFSEIKNRAVLTPHAMEFSRLSGFSLEEISDDKKESFNKCKKFASEHGIILLLKGKNTLITDGASVYINSTGNSHMANGGMGDGLTGIISSLVGQNYSLYESTKIGCFLHGYIGDALLEEQYIINISHIIENIPKYMKIIFENKK